MSSWRWGVNQYGNRYDQRGESYARGGSYHYSNTDGSYYYQNKDGSTYYRSSDNYAVYTAPADNHRCYESSESEKEIRYAPKKKRSSKKKANGKVNKAKSSKKASRKR